MTVDDFKHQLPDIDEAETQDWVESFDQVLDQEGENRARFLMYKLLKRARQRHVGLPSLTQTRYINTISPEQEPYFPGDEELERRIRRLIRWNAVAMVLRSNSRFSGIGGHLATYASAASLYEVGFNHFFKGKDHPGGGDQVFFQGHAAPGIYARAFLEGRLTEEHLDHFRRETSGKGLSSYPHPRLMPDFWEFPTVSMGLGPLAAVYQARFNRYLQNRGLKDTSQQRVWAFLGDGEMDEPESISGISLAARDGLDNLTFVINCNLQRLDGPVRGNGKVIQELEGLFRGAGWNVIKVVWGREWDELLARDVDGTLVEKMNTTVDGEFQKMSVSTTGGYVREHFFGPDPRLRRMVEHLSDDQLLKLRRGGHDYHKVFAAYLAATEFTGAPTVILAKTVKGWTLGRGVEARNITHQAKKLSEAELRVFRDRLELPIPDEQLKDAPYFHPGPDSEEVQYMLQRRAALGGPLPRRVVRAEPLPLLGDADRQGVRRRAARPRSPRRWCSRASCATSSATRRSASASSRSSRTRRARSAWTRCSRRSASTPRAGSTTTRSTRSSCLSYREAKDGQVLEEGINEAGSMASLQAAGTSYATHGEPMIPFYIFYSMFGFQRTGDQAWAFGDQRGRGFMIGATAGRTTLAGEGLQHDDGHSHILASTVPVVRAYDPAFAYELAHDRPRRHPADVHRRRGRLLLRHRLQRELRPGPRSPRARTRASSRASTGSRRRPRSRSPRAASGSSARGRSSSRCSRRGTCCATRGHRRRGLLRDLVPAAPPRGAPGRALEPAPPGQARPRSRTSSRCWARRAARSSSPPTGSEQLPDMVAPLGQGAVHRARHGRLSAAATPARTCAPGSASTRPHIVGGRATPASSSAASSSRRRPRRRSASSGMDPESSDPLTA